MFLVSVYMFAHISYIVYLRAKRREFPEGGYLRGRLNQGLVAFSVSSFLSRIKCKRHFFTYTLSFSFLVS